MATRKTTSRSTPPTSSETGQTVAYLQNRHTVVEMALHGTPLDSQEYLRALVALEKQFAALPESVRQHLLPPPVTCNAASPKMIPAKEMVKLLNQYRGDLTTDAGAASPMDVQIGGDHYKKMKIQPMEFSMMNGLDACQHTIVKYVTRFREKGGVQDLEKAKHVIDMLIEFEQRRNP